MAYTDDAKPLWQSCIIMAAAVMLYGPNTLLLGTFLLVTAGCCIAHTVHIVPVMLIVVNATFLLHTGAQLMHASDATAGSPWPGAWQGSCQSGCAIAGLVGTGAPAGDARHSSYFENVLVGR